MLPDFDFSLYKGKDQIKGFTLRNEDGTFYNLTNLTVRLDLYLDGPLLPPVQVSGVIGVGSNVTFTFLSTLIVNEGFFEYVIIEKKLTLEETPILRGNITVTSYTAFSDTISSFLTVELPFGFILDSNFVSQKIRYWRLFLQEGFNISDANLNRDSAWPILVNVLIAKLIAYDSLVLAIKGNLLTIFGSSSTGTTINTSTNAGGIKSITTGPSKVEFHAAGETMSQIIRSSSGTSAGNSSLLSNMAEDLCGLARKLTVKLPMCQAEKLVKVFQFYKKPAPPSIFDECDPVSRG